MDHDTHSRNYPLENVDKWELCDLIRRAWSDDTSVSPSMWSTSIPELGQAPVTSVVVQDHLGGDILRSTVKGMVHYWNRLPDGTELDITKGQFKKFSLDSPGEVRDREYVMAFEVPSVRYESMVANLVGLV